MAEDMLDFARRRLTASGSAAMTHVLGPDVFCELAFNLKTVINKQLVAGLDGGDCTDEDSIASQRGSGSARCCLSGCRRSSEVVETGKSAHADVVRCVLTSADERS
jgi:hypothetical protein